MMNMTEIPLIQPYSLPRAEKRKLLDPNLTTLSRHHYKQCEPYRRMMDAIGFDLRKDYHYIDLPFLPVKLFGMIELRSILKEQIVRTLTSSGTSGQARSQVFLDKETAAIQTKVLARIMSSFIGNKRLPVIIIDSEKVFNRRLPLSADFAAISGFSLFGSTRIFALNEDMKLNTGLLHSFLHRHENERIIIFGFTFNVYRHFCLEVLKTGIKPDLSNSVLIHGGGWKKLECRSVSSEEFKNKLYQACGIQNVHNYYGMVEQAGSIYLECEYGHLHTSVYSEIVIRRAIDFSVADVGEEGIIQVLSILPKSYPGHSLLTEDKGVLLGEDNCSCKRLGKYFKVTGRLEHSEMRGCSDTYGRKIN